eukprot:TRINITY_DN26168_c0_g1_i1.p2 TRINITY_DN26168_c0_g1~~TRINITY_DN26168_c0_g1_i1.p2  ORF type:complete len:579 (+),score=153.22 TRINITY_DN26168_c0_g1_i1:28-1764(+)
MFFTTHWPRGEMRAADLRPVSGAATAVRAPAPAAAVPPRGPPPLSGSRRRLPLLIVSVCGISGWVALMAAGPPTQDFAAVGGGPVAAGGSAARLRGGAAGAPGAGGGGCPALRGREECLAGRDLRGEYRDMPGAGVWDQPCLWCCGEPCVPPGAAPARGAGGVLAAALAAAVPPGALCVPAAWARQQPGLVPRHEERGGGGGCEEAAEAAPGAVALRRRDGVLCRDLTGAAQCVASRDGAAQQQGSDAAAWAGDPCAWCCGSGCFGAGSARCAPLRLVRAHSAATGHYRTADESSCPGAAPQDGPALAYREDVGCVDYTDREGCLSARDGRSEFRDREEQDIWNQPCIWCCGRSCVAGGPARCEARRYALAMPGFSGQYADHESDRCPTERDLYEEGVGCTSHTDRASCIAHRDGRSEHKSRKPSDIWDQPCIWCCGKSCIGEGAKCEPKAYTLSNVPQLKYDSADERGCDAAQPRAGQPQAVGVAQESPLAGLRYEEGRGCDNYKTRLECIAHRDGRSGMKDRKDQAIWNNPCIWCCGEPCGVNDKDTPPTRCEPKGWALQAKTFTGRYETRQENHC